MSASRARPARRDPRARARDQRSLRARLTEALRPRRAPSWVSKTDVMRYLRCPYAFWQIDRGAISANAALDALGAQLVDDGHHFHAAVAADAQPLPAGTTLADAFAGDLTVHGLPPLRNRALRIRGIPDAVIAASGELVPVEIKSHRDVRHTDELELAFYWLLLEPYRTRPAAHPRGRLVLRRDQQPVELDIELTPAHFSEVHTLVAQVRAARRDGVRPRVCGCTVCAGPLREQILRRTRAGRDLTLIWGIGRRIAARLEDLGIPDYDALLTCDPVEVALALRPARVCVSPPQVHAWAQHAASYRDAAPAAFGTPAPVGDGFIALDLEYDPLHPHIWLTGLLVVDGDQRAHTALWAGDLDQERHALSTLADVCARHPALPIVTWAGTSADLPQLRHAARRHELDSLANTVEARHVDLYQHAIRTVRLPIPRLGLDAVAHYFAIPKVSQITDGRHAQWLYDQRSTCPDPQRRAALRAEVTAYNRDDLEALVEIKQALETISRPPAHPKAAQTATERAEPSTGGGTLRGPCQPRQTGSSPRAQTGVSRQSWSTPTVSPSSPDRGSQT